MNIASDRRTIAFARPPSLIRDAARGFRRVTGLTVVTTPGSASPDTRTRDLPSPPTHPLCAKTLRELPGKGPCDAEWRKHLRSAVKTRGGRIHTCPLGLRCAGVPIVLDDELLGLAKLVSGPEISKDRFRFLVGLLEDLIARPCQEFYVLLLQEEIGALRISVKRLRRTRRPALPDGNHARPPPAEVENSRGSLKAETLISRVLDYPHEHDADSKHSLHQVAAAVGKNEKCLAHLFAEQVGERMQT